MEWEPYDVLRAAMKAYAPHSESTCNGVKKHRSGAFCFSFISFYAFAVNIRAIALASRVKPLLLHAPLQPWPLVRY